MIVSYSTEKQSSDEMSGSEGADYDDANTGEKKDDSHGPVIVADNPEKNSHGSDEALSSDNQL